MRTVLRLRALAVVCVLLPAVGRPAVARAQLRRDLPSVADCAQWAQSLAAGGQAAIETLDRGWLAGCPNSGPAALASALRGARAETDTAYLVRLADVAGNLEHPAILAAALELAGDRGATTAARATALLVLPGQLGAGPGVNGLPGGVLLTQPLPATGVCAPGLRATHAAAPASAASRGDAPRRVAAVVDRIRTDASEPDLLRSLARCVRPAVKGVPPQVDVSAVRLTYVCGNWFRVRNPTRESLLFEFVAEGTGERRRLRVSAGGERTIATDAPARVRLYYDGRSIQAAANGGAPCPK